VGSLYVLDAALLIELDIPTRLVTTDRDQSKFDRDMEEARLREAVCMKASWITRAPVTERATRSHYTAWGPRAKPCR
jgi:hypothetical protein